MLDGSNPGSFLYVIMFACICRNTVVLNQHFTFPLVFGAFLLQAIVVLPSGEVTASNMAVLQGRIPAEGIIHSKTGITFPDEIRGGIPSVVTCTWKVGHKPLVGLKVQKLLAPRIFHLFAVMIFA